MQRHGLIFTLGFIAFLSGLSSVMAAEPRWKNHQGRRETLRDAAGQPMRLLVFPAHTPKPRAVLICLHGIQTHADWFSLMAPTLQREGITVFAPDRRGSGRGRNTQDPVAKIQSSEEWLADLDRVLSRAKKEGCGVWLLGTSWGAKPALAFAARHPDDIAGTALLVPALKTHQETLGRTAGGLFGYLFRPNDPLKLPLDDSLYLPARPGGPTPADLALKREITSDSWLLRHATYRFMKTAKSLQTEALRQWKTPRMREEPLLAIFAGSSDQIVRLDQSRDLLPKVKTRRIEVVEGEGHGVQVQNPRRVAALVAGWMRSPTSSRE